MKCFFLGGALGFLTSAGLCFVEAVRRPGDAVALAAALLTVGIVFLLVAALAPEE